MPSSPLRPAGPRRPTPLTLHADDASTGREIWLESPITGLSPQTRLSPYLEHCGNCATTNSRRTIQDASRPSRRQIQPVWQWVLQRGKEKVNLFGEELRRLRRRSGLSQETLAARAGLSPEAVSLLERGRRSPRMTTMRLLA